jgi:fatty-acyl-CoA synthase
MALTGADVALAVVPMFHATPGVWLPAPMVGAKLVFPGPKMGDAATLVALMNEEGVTIAAGVPTVWTLLLNYLDQSGVKVRTLTRTLVGGSAVPLQMIRDFDQKHGVKVMQGWGMTEMSPLGTVGSLRPELESLPAEDRYRSRGTGARHLRRADEDRG